MRFGGGRTAALLGSLIALVLVDCNAYDPPVSRVGTGGTPAFGAGGVPLAMGTGGRVQTFLCPPPHSDCCYPQFARSFCSGDAVCTDYPQATDCGRRDCQPPCLFGCAEGRCLPDPNAPPNGGAGGLGGFGGFGGDPQ